MNLEEKDEQIQIFQTEKKENSIKTKNFVKRMI